MRIVYLQGGLGNQLFQYAFARALEIRYNSKVKFDLSWFDSENKLRRYELGGFNINIERASDLEMRKAQKLSFNPMRDMINLIGNKTQNSIIIEKSHIFDPSYFNKKHKKYYKGFWQNEKYFKEINDIVSADLRFTTFSTNRNLELKDYLQKCKNSVSVHFRRADYTEEINKSFGVLEIGYYEEALKRIENKIGPLELFIFSDDLDWVKNNWQTNHKKVFVDWNDSSNIVDDLQLMSLCEHNIIANSTYSWWGAWLNKNSKKMVIGPKQWFADSNKNADASGILPETWIRI